MDERLKRANENLPTVDIKGKSYVMVKDRVSAFRREYEGWSLVTEVIADDGKEITVKASVISDDGVVRATGHASEVRGAGNINRTSALENCESSAIGRCLGNLGIGIDDSFGTADEVGNAIMGQSKPTEDFNPNQKISERDAKNLIDVLAKYGYTEDEVCTMYEVESISDLNLAQYKDAVMRAQPKEKNVIKA